MLSKGKELLAGWQRPCRYVALSPGSAEQLGFPAQTHQTSSSLPVLTLSYFSLLVKKKHPNPPPPTKNPIKPNAQHLCTVPTTSQERGRWPWADSPQLRAQLGCLTGSGSFVTILPPIYKSAKETSRSWKIVLWESSQQPLHFPGRVIPVKATGFHPLVSRKNEKKKNL